MPSLPYASPVESRIARAIVGDAIKAGLYVTVYDGEAINVRRSNVQPIILDNMGHTESDTLHFHSETGAKVGWVHLVWGNDADLISDSTTSAAMVKLLARAESIANEA
jgi:hypothetical protein